ncbi:hypothetical protein [Micromonospora sp. NPDC005161]
MLSSNAVHTLAGCLLAADADAETLGWGQPATLLLIHDRPLNTAGPKRRREMRSLEFPLHRDDLLTDPAGLPALLHRLAASLDNPDAPTPYQATLATIVGLIRATAPDARLLAWAACYDDIRTVDSQPRQARRVDAVDIDRRVYQLTRLRGEDHPLLLVDDSPDPGDIPATGPGLAALLAATARHTLTRIHADAACGPQVPPHADPDEPIFGVCGPDNASIRCRICGAVDRITSDEVPSMAGYGEDTYIRCIRCGSVETTDPIFGWRAKPAPWPPHPTHDQP